MAKRKTMLELQTDIILLRTSFELGYIKPREYRRRYGSLIRRILDVQRAGGDTDGTETAPGVPAGMAMS